MKKVINKFIFIIALIIKAIDGLLEMVGGFLLLTINPLTLNKIVIFLTQHELTEDPNDFIATSLIKIATNYQINTQHFASLYFLSHGFLKVFLVVFLFLKRVWAY